MAKRGVRWLLAMGVGFATGACKDDDGGGAAEAGTTGGGDGSSGDPSVAESSGDSLATADGESSTGDGPTEVEWVFEDVYGVINVDDDDENGSADWLQVIFDGEDDHSVIPLPALPPGHSARLELAGDLEHIRIWRGPTSISVGAGDGEFFETDEFTPESDGSELWVEFGADNVAGSLILTHLDADGTAVESAEIVLRSSPLILNHHLQPTEHVWVVEVNAGYGSNADMIADYADALGNLFTAVPGPQYDGDVWIQDEFQFAFATGSQGQRADTVIDSIRDRELDPWAEQAIEGPGTNVRTWGVPNQATTWDSFGNLENSPPVTVDGVEYPFGRVYYGRQGTLGMHSQLATKLQEQGVQAPIEMDTMWLCVGHVDEFSTFVPDPSAPKGFRFVISDVPAAWAVLEDVSSSTALTRYGADHGYPTVRSLLEDTALRNLNDDLQADELDPILAQAIAEFGLEEADIIRLPSLFESVSGCGGGVASLVPGMVNLIVAPLETETHLFIADPYFRTDLDDQSSDPFIAAFNDLLPDTLIPHYVDDWDVYHLAMGEVHCGTNMTQTPTENWWEVGLHLL